MNPRCKCGEELELLSFDMDSGDATWLCRKCDREFRLDHNDLQTEDTP
jgi:hypothetical protein